jgi:acetyl-CoA C-acetyltransferase
VYDFDRALSADPGGLTLADAYLFGGVRTPFGRHAGALAGVRPDDLAALAIRETLARFAFAAGGIDDVILGCASQAGEDSRNVARHAALLAGLPPGVPAQTVNRLCGSGLAAIIDAARAVRCGDAGLVMAGGVESMSRAPFVVGKAESPYARELKVFDSSLGARFPNPAFVKQFGNDTMPETAENLAREMDITRADSDAFALRSQQACARAKAAGFFDEEIVPVSVTGRKGATLVSDDEHPRPDATPEGLARLRPLQDGGVVTAGNASGINDGAAAVLIGAANSGARPLARIVASAVAGVEPRVMGIGPALAIPRALERAGLTLSQVDVIEVNEAFSTQVLACLKRLGLAFDDPRVNPNGGAIALGHPLGASGARLALTAARELERRSARYAVVSLCIGVGQGIALVLERCG